jgi:hypothetical protein
MNDFFEKHPDTGEELLSGNGERALYRLSDYLHSLTNAQLLDYAKELAPYDVILTDMACEFGYEQEEDFCVEFALGMGRQKELCNMRMALIEKCYDRKVYAIDLDINYARSFLWGSF